jgi:23S rRNA pseudouridine2605 synthase
MAFKKPGNSRDGQSGRSSNRPSKGDDNSKKSFSSSRGKSTRSSDSAGSAQKRKYSGEGSGEKRSYSSDSKPYGERSGSGEQRSSFSGGDKKAYAPKRPYSGRPSDGDAHGDKKSFTPRNKPYSGRVTSDDGPPKSFGGGSDERKSFTPRDKSYSGRSNNDDRPPRSFSNDSGDKKPFARDNKPYSGRSSSDDRPPKSFSNDSSGERKFGGAGSKPRERSGDKKFEGSRPRSEGGFKKRESSAGDKTFRQSAGARDGSKPKYDKIGTDRDAPAKTLRPKKPTAKDDGLIRLNRYIANAGICSRRKADDLIIAGTVTVNGEVVSELGSKIDPMKDEIRYNGETLKREKMTYVLLNKPKDYITTTDDPQERRTVMHLVEKASRERIYPIGRLDRNTTGLLLMTNDGDLADKLSHPRSNITKLYQVELSKNLSQGDLNKLQFGLELEDGPIKPDSVSYVAGGSKREVGIQIHSGKNRIVRRMFEHLGYEVVKLDRVVYANLTKKDLPRGRWRYLEEQEIIQLKHLIK